MRLHSPLPFDSPYYTGCQFVCETSRVFVIFVASPAVLRGRYRRRCRPVLPAVPQASSLSFLRCCRRRHRLPCGAAGVVFIPCLCDACAARAYSLPSLSPCGAAGVVVVVVFPAVLQASSSLSSLRCCRRRRRCRRPPCGAAGVVVVSEQTDVHAAHPCEFASVKWARM